MIHGITSPLRLCACTQTPLSARDFVRTSFLLLVHSAKMSAKHETIYFEANIAANKQKLQRVQDIMSLALGVGAGILGLESLYGFLFFLLGFSLSNLAFFVECCKGESKTFFTSPFRLIFLDGFFGGLAGYVMMWCLTYALVN